ncbi:MAG: hypothetical protein SNJ72_11200, partial [Fimbriimonadales bacterium]
KALSFALPRWIATPLPEVLTQLDFVLSAPMGFILPVFWATLLIGASYCVGWWRGFKMPIGRVGLVGALVAYVPLAFAVPLMHYYYLASVFRALWAVVLIQGILELCTTMRPMRRATLDATEGAMCPKRSSPP